MIEVDALVFFAHFVTDHVVHLAGEVKLVAVGEVSAVVEVKTHDGVAGFDYRAVCGLIGL